MWFAGVHSEVGGGTDASALSDITLLWMAEQAQLAGLVFIERQPGTGWPELNIGPATPNYAGELHDSRHGLFKLERSYHRLAEPPAQTGPDHAGQAISSTAAHRAADVAGYAPEGLAQYLAALGQPVNVEPSRE